MISNNKYIFLVIAISTVLGSIFVSAILAMGPNSPLKSAVINGDLAPTVVAAALPLSIDHHYKPKAQTGDAREDPRNVQIFENDVIDPERHCEGCSLFRYTPGSKGVAEIVYAISSSDLPLDLSAASHIRLFVMGEKGGEKIRFNIAGKSLGSSEAGKTKEHQVVSYALRTEQITLTDDWEKIELDLDMVGKEKLAGITHPFGIEIFKSSGSEKQGVFVKYIIFE